MVVRRQEVGFAWQNREYGSSKFATEAAFYCFIVNLFSTEWALHFNPSSHGDLLTMHGGRRSQPSTLTNAAQIFKQKASQKVILSSGLKSAILALTNQQLRSRPEDTLSCSGRHQAGLRKKWHKCYCMLPGSVVTMTPVIAAAAEPLHIRNDKEQSIDIKKI